MAFCRPTVVWWCGTGDGISGSVSKRVEESVQMELVLQAMGFVDEVQKSMAKASIE
jgi:hypothetical protein